MTSIDRLDKKDVKEICEICDSVFDKNFHITEKKLEENLFNTEDYFSEGSFIARGIGGKACGFIGVKISEEDEVYPDTAWISIFAVRKDMRHEGIGSSLLEHALQRLSLHGVKRVYLGQDYNNFFSGIPSPDEENIGFFKKEGFWINDMDHYDLEAGIVTNEKIEDFDTEDYEKNYRISVYDGQKNELLEFLEKEFPGRWEFEAETALAEGKSSEEIVLLWSRTEEKIVGYCMLDGAGKEYGGLGPIGIAKKVRGNHVGDYILRESLMQLRKLGVKTVNIDWTILKDFYGQFGFEPERTYRGAYRDIS